MYCKNCGTEIPDNSMTCPECGASLQETVSINDGINDNGGFLWGLLGCCIPILGLVLYLVWKDTKPKTAKDVGKGAIAGAVIIALYYIAVIVLGVGTAMLGTVLSNA